MFNQMFFAQNLKLLREIHNLSNADLSELIGLKSRTSISDFEALRTFPSSKVLADIADLFGVSIDWLSGRSNEAYKNDILLYLEEEYLKQLIIETHEVFQKFERYRIPYTFILQCPKYQDKDWRMQSLSLPLRANILFMFFWFKNIESRTDYVENPFLAIGDGFASFKNALVESLSLTPKKHRKIYETGHYYIDTLEKILLTKEISTPVFDIFKPLE
ncbi:helix-turn-helix domain-containing protein [Anaerosinus sp.]|uniref:helix-turn-helix domain-containing protein n=1 Tax=Selenobaculum sp. TaxID=3074374 RepID=UPI003AB49541